jgi:hypothetical protein
MMTSYISNNRYKTNPRKYNIEGAPFKINNLVRILNNPNKDETFNKNLSGKKGYVEYFEYDCGCGQKFPEDPMIGVRFCNKKVDEFWKEELELFTF